MRNVAFVIAAVAFLSTGQTPGAAQTRIEDVRAAVGASLARLHDLEFTCTNHFMIDFPENSTDLITETSYGQSSVK